MRIRQGIERALRRLEQLQSSEDDGSPHTFVFNGTEYPCSVTNERVGLEIAYGGATETITAQIIVRAEALAGAAFLPAAGHLLTRPDIEQEFRVLTASLSADGSHLTLDLGDPLNQ